MKKQKKERARFDCSRVRVCVCVCAWERAFVCAMCMGADACMLLNRGGVYTSDVYGDVYISSHYHMYGQKVENVRGKKNSICPQRLTFGCATPGLVIRRRVRGRPSACTIGGVQDRR